MEAPYLQTMKLFIKEINKATHRNDKKHEHQRKQCNRMDNSF